MATTKQTVSVRLNPEAKQRIEKAAKLMKQSSGAFLGKAGEEAARAMLVGWAISRHRQGAASFSELAEQTGLAVEEIMEAAGSQGREAALEMFLASCRTVAETQDDPQFLRLGEEAAKAVSQGIASAGGISFPAN